MRLHNYNYIYICLHFRRGYPKKKKKLLCISLLSSSKVKLVFYLIYVHEYIGGFCGFISVPKTKLWMQPHHINWRKSLGRLLYAISLWWAYINGLFTEWYSNKQKNRIKKRCRKPISSEPISGDSGEAMSLLQPA